MLTITTNKLSSIRSGDSGPPDITRSSLKVHNESDEDFVMEGNEDSLSSSEDDKDITDEDSSGFSGDSTSRENVKLKVSLKGKDRGNKEKSPEDGDDSSDDEEVCSVCEVLNIIVCYKSVLQLRVFNINPCPGSSSLLVFGITTLSCYSDTCHYVGTLG